VPVENHSQKLTGEPLRWLEDAQECFDGIHGQWWEDRGVIAIQDGPGTWQSWRDIRQSEHEPLATTCRGCGCTDDHACPEGCWWVEKGPRPLCSSCTNPDYVGPFTSAEHLDIDVVPIPQPPVDHYLEPTRRPDGDLTANVAAYRTGTGGCFARVLKDGDTLDGQEWRTVAHFAVCPKAVQHREARKGAVENVIPFPTAQARRRLRSVTE